MPVQTRSQLKSFQVNRDIEEINKEEDEKQKTALILLKIRKDNDDLKYQLKQELQMKKEELKKLKEIKKLTDEYNMIKMIVNTYTEKAKILELEIIQLKSSMDQ